MIDKELLESARSGTSRHGKTHLINYLNGKTITRGQAISAKCYDCDGMGKSGICDIKACPLYPYSSFKR